MSTEINPPRTRTDGPAADTRASRGQTIINWVLAGLTLSGAAAVELLGFGEALGTDACSDRACPHLGTANAVFGPIVYGAPVVAVLAIAGSFFTAHRRRGWILPACAWVLLIAGAIVLAVTLRQ